MVRLSRWAGGHAGLAIIPLATAMVAPLAAQQSYGFVVRLGRDTVAMERVRRSADRLIGDVVERNPGVTIRHYEATLAPDGTVQRFVIDSRPGNPVPGRPASQHVELDFRTDSLRAAVGVGDSASVTVYPTGSRLAMPWLTATYGTSEQLLLAALKRPGDSIPVTLYLPAGRLAGTVTTFVHRYGRDSASIEYLKTPIMAQLDRQGRIASLSGDRTTNKVHLTRLDLPPDIESIAVRFSAVETAAGGAVAALCPRDTARGTIGAAVLMVDYGRPRLRGRAAIGRLVPLDSVWRTGANEATQFRTSMAITLAGTRLEPGLYTLWTELTTSGPTLIVNRQTGQWGTKYDATQDLARAPLKAETLATPVEAFTIRIEPTGSTTGKLVMEWDRFQWTAEIVLK